MWVFVGYGFGLHLQARCQHNTTPLLTKVLFLSQQVGLSVFTVMPSGFDIPAVKVGENMSVFKPAQAGLWEIQFLAGGQT